MKWVILTLGIPILLLIYPKAETTEHIPEWCFYAEYDSMEHYQATTAPGNTVFIEMKGKKVLVYTKYLAYPLPHCIEPTK